MQTLRQIELLALLLALTIAVWLISAYRWRATEPETLGVMHAGDPAETLTLAFSTYLGGSNEDTVRDVTTDREGNIYLTGGTGSSNFPTTPGAYDRMFNSGGNSLGSAGPHDVFVVKLSPSGQLLWSTLLGGPNYDRAYAIEVDSQGSIYIAGRAGDGFPTTAGSAQPKFGGDVNPNSLYGQQDGFVAKLSPDGSQVIWSTYLGGDDRSFIRDIDVDGSGNVYLVLTDVSRPNPHITPGAFQTQLQGGVDGVIAKMASSGSRLLWATYLGGSGYDVGTPSIRVDAQGYPYVLGFTNSSNLPTTLGAYDRTYNGGGDFYLAKLLPDGSNLVYGTYLGGSQVEFSETHGFALDAQGDGYVAATTKSPDFPTSPGAFQRIYGGSGDASTGGNTNYPGDAFVAKISADGSQLLASTFVGGRFGEGTEGVAVDTQGNVYLSGATYSDNFPVTTGAFKASNSGSSDFFAVKLSANLSQLLYATYLGGSDDDYARTAHADSRGNFYVAGHTTSNNWPTRNALQACRHGNWDGALAKFTLDARTGGVR
ncbi:MAG: SBBP repeat-containing protein [Acidobacteria bacterium]|nr:SBBP repeat-containing protein [Acidobacteriota bacterium]